MKIQLWYQLGDNTLQVWGTILCELLQASAHFMVLFLPQPEDTGLGTKVQILEQFYCYF